MVRSTTGQLQHAASAQHDVRTGGDPLMRACRLTHTRQNCRGPVCSPSTARVAQQRAPLLARGAP
eukprot:10406-Eustigmatos_ZCMA.PRE.1